MPAGAYGRFPWLADRYESSGRIPVVNRCQGTHRVSRLHRDRGHADYSSPAATVLFDSGIANTFAYQLDRSHRRNAYTIGVRAYNAVAEESNTNAVTVEARSTGPIAVVSLTAIPTS